jgi:membrane protease YdiL (CAAX protease family)
MHVSITISNRQQWTRLLLGLCSVYVLFHWSATTLGSERGQAGLLVAALVVSATLGIECLWSGLSIPSAARAIGLGRPRLQGLAISAGICGLALLVVPIFARSTGSAVTAADGWLALLPGLFAQGGIAEETLFRGYLFGHLRVGRSFWRAALLSMLPFVAVHLVLFLTLPLAVAGAALLLAVVMSFPLAQLFELGGATIWPPALLHFVTQATVKVLVFTGDTSWAFPYVWMIASTALPLLVFIIPRSRSDL